MKAAKTENWLCLWYHELSFLMQVISDEPVIMSRSMSYLHYRTELKYLLWSLVWNSAPFRSACLFAKKVPSSLADEYKTLRKQMSFNLKSSLFLRILSYQNAGIFYLRSTGVCYSTSFKTSTSHKTSKSATCIT